MAQEGLAGAGKAVDFSALEMNIEKSLSRYQKALILRHDLFEPLALEVSNQAYSITKG